MIFTHGGVLKLERYGATRFLHGECRRYTFDGERMIRDPAYDIGQHLIPQDQISLLKEKDIASIQLNNAAANVVDGGNDLQEEGGGEDGGAKECGVMQ